MRKLVPEIEQKLVIGLINGEKSAFCELYAYYKDRLMWFASRLLKSNYLAEDVFQEAFISIWENRANVNPDQPFSPYLYAVIRNRIFTMIKSMDREEFFKENILGNALDVTNEVEDKLIDKDLNLLLQQIISTLTPRQAKIFKMSREDMMSHKEIAEALDISVAVVQKNITESLKLIKSGLSKYSDTYVSLLLLFLWINR